MKKLFSCFAFILINFGILSAQFPLTIDVESNGSIFQSPTTEFGKKYRITVEGMYSMWPQFKDCHGVDAAYVWDVPQEEIDSWRWPPQEIEIGGQKIEIVKLPHWVGDPKEWKIPPEELGGAPLFKLSFYKYKGFRIDNEPLPNTGFQSLTHKYSIEKIGTGAPFQFQILDSNYSVIEERAIGRYEDNCGALKVTIEKLDEDTTGNKKDIKIEFNAEEWFDQGKPIGYVLDISIDAKDTTKPQGERNIISELEEGEIAILHNGKIICDIDSIVCNKRSEPLAIGLLIDKTESMQGPISMQDGTERMSASKKAISSFVENLIEKDEAFVMSFNESYYLEQDWTNDISKLKAAINSLIPEKLTAVYGAIVNALVKLSTHKNPNRVLIVLSDGGNTYPPSWEESNVLSIAQQKNIPVYVVALGFTNMDIDVQGRTKLDMITKATPRGKLYDVYSSKALDSVYKELSQSLTTDEDCYIYYRTADSCKPGEEKWIRVIYAPDDSTLITRVVKFKCPVVTGIVRGEYDYDDEINKVNINIQPNPFEYSTSIKYSIQSIGDVTVSISDLMGNFIDNIIFKQSEPGEYVYIIDGKKLNTGTYIATVTHKNQTVSRKIVVIH